MGRRFLAWTVTMLTSQVAHETDHANVRCDTNHDYVDTMVAHPRKDILFFLVSFLITFLNNDFSLKT